MKHEKKTIGTIEVLGIAGHWVRQSIKPLLLISIVGLITPSFLISTIIDIQGSETAALLRDLDLKNLSEVANPTLGFVSLLVITILGWAATIATSYLGLVHLIYENQLGKSKPSAWTALLYGLKLLVPRGFILLILLSLFVGMAQFLLLPGVVIAVLSTMAPIILVAENKGSVRSITDAVFMRYVNSSNINRWGAFASLLYVVGLYYITLIGIILINQRLLELDMFSSFPRQLYLYHFHDRPFGIAYFFIKFFTTALEQLALCALAVVTTTLYVLQKKQNTML